MKNLKKGGAMVLRGEPVHLGHEATMKKMFSDNGFDRSLIIFGSINVPISYRTLFGFEVRRGFVLKIFPEMRGRVVGLPDYPTDEEWLENLDMLLADAGFDPKETIFYGGCEEDIRFFVDDGRECKILNRFDGTTPKVSATEVRDALVNERPLAGLVNPIIEDDVRNEYWKSMEKLASLKQKQLKRKKERT